MRRVLERSGAWSAPWPWTSDAPAMQRVASRTVVERYGRRVLPRNVTNGPATSRGGRDVARALRCQANCARLSCTLPWSPLARNCCMKLLAVLESIETERRRDGARFNTIVCRPQHLDTWAHATVETLRLVFAEHGLRLHVDAASPWAGIAALWIEPSPATATA